MQLNFSLVNILLLFGALQGLIFSLILFFNKKHPGAKFLSAFMFVLAYNGFETFNWSAGLDKYYILMDIFPFVLVFAIGPSIYLYVTSLLSPDRKISSKTILAHYSIVLFQFFFRSTSVVVYLLWLKKTPEGENAFQQIETVYWLYSEPLSIIVFIAYLIAAIRKFKQSGDLRKNNLLLSKEAWQVSRKWLRALLTFMAIMAVLWPITVIASYYTKEVGDAYYPIEVLLVFFIYWIAFAGYHKIMLIYPNGKGNQKSVPPNVAAEFVALQQLMKTEKLYLDSELNLAKLASRTGIAPKTISSILNQYGQTNFNDFINQYRVGDIKLKLVDPNFQHLTISGIAFDTGFNSQATFQRAFKNFTGLSPSQYVSRYKKDIQHQPTSLG